MTEDGKREGVYFQGPFVDFVEGKVRIVEDVAKRDFNGLLGETTELAFQEYGRAWTTLNGGFGEGLMSLIGPEVDMHHSQHNDKVIQDLTSIALMG